MKFKQIDESNCCGASVIGEWGEGGNEGYCGKCGEPCERLIIECGEVEGTTLPPKVENPQLVKSNA